MVKRYASAIVLAALITSACGAATPVASPSVAPSAAVATSAATATPKPPTAKISFIEDFPPFGYWVPWLAGKEQGFFKDEAIDIDVVPGQSSGDATSKVGAGTAQFGLADATTAIVAIANGTPITLIAAHWQQHVGGLCTMADKKHLTSVKDVVGLKIGASPGSAYILMLPFLMKQAGVDPKFDVINMNAQAQTAALLSGQIDAIPCGSSTVGSRMLSVKAQGRTMEFFSYADHGVTALGHAIIVNNDVLKNDPGLVQRFMNAYAKSVVWSKLNVDKAVASYTSLHPEQDAAGERANYEATLRFEVDPRSTSGQFFMDPARIKQAVDLAKDAYDKTVDPSKVYTNQFVERLPDALRKGKLP
jgi:NitT/TauT family transport system substrate-binding protein